MTILLFIIFLYVFWILDSEIPFLETCDNKHKILFWSKPSMLQFVRLPIFEENYMYLLYVETTSCMILIGLDNS